jgi:hypothetical protein
MAAKNTKDSTSLGNRACAYGRAGDTRNQNRFFATFCGQNSVGLFRLLIPSLLRLPSSRLWALSSGLLRPSVLRPLSCVLCLALLLSAPPPRLHAADTPAPALTEATASELGQLRELTDQPNYPAALTLLDRLLAAAPADSYDTALLSQIKAQILLQQSRYADAIAPLETALRLGERHDFFPPATRRDSLFLIAQLYQNRAADTQSLPEQRALLDRAASYLARRQQLAPQSTPELQLFAASLHYQRATLDSTHPDLTALAESRRAAHEGLVLQLTPNLNLYVLLLADAQQREDFATSADLLELLVSKKPDSESYWRQLVSTYLTLAATAAPDERAARRFNIRALLAFERARDHGFLTSPADAFNRVAILLTLQRTDEAIAFLETGLADGTLANTRRTWEVLANTYQQIHRDAAALASLEKAVDALPADGQLEFTVAQLHYAAGRLPEARTHLERALTKPTPVDKPGQARLFLAYIAYELKAYDDAARWAREALAYDDAKPADITRLDQAIREATAKR